MSKAIAVIRYDDIELARLGAMPQTTTATTPEYMGAEVADLLLE